MASESTEYTLRVPERLCPSPALSCVGHCRDCALLGLCSLKKKDSLKTDLGSNQHEMEPTGGRKAVKLAGRGVGSSCLVAPLSQVRVEGRSGISTTYLPAHVDLLGPLTYVCPNRRTSPIPWPLMWEHPSNVQLLQKPGLLSLL